MAADDQSESTSITTPSSPNDSAVLHSPLQHQLHPDSAYSIYPGHQTPPYHVNDSHLTIDHDSTLSLSSMPSSPVESPLLTEMKRILSTYSFTRRQRSWGGKSTSSSSSRISSTTLGTTLSTSSSSSASSSPNNRQAEPLQLQDRYGSEYRKGKIIGQGATAVIQLLEMPVCPSWIPVEKTHQRRSRKKKNKVKTVVAIKAFRKQDRGETEREYQKRMTSEFCISKAIRHPHIVEMFDLVKDHKNRWCTVMEYVRETKKRRAICKGLISLFFFSFHY